MLIRKFLSTSKLKKFHGLFIVMIIKVISNILLLKNSRLYIYAKEGEGFFMLYVLLLLN